jgi:hypothetical protein
VEGVVKWVADLKEYNITARLTEMKNNFKKVSVNIHFLNNNNNS